MSDDIDAATARRDDLQAYIQTLQMDLRDARAAYREKAAEVERLRADEVTLDELNALWALCNEQFAAGRAAERDDVVAHMTDTARVFRFQGDAIEWKVIKDERDRILRGEHVGAASPAQPTPPCDHSFVGGGALKVVCEFCGAQPTSPSEEKT